MFRLRIPVIPKIVSWVNRLIFGCWVPSSATLGKNVVLGYWGIGVVIHSDSVIGDNTLISQNVTIGRNKKGARYSTNWQPSICCGWSSGEWRHNDRRGCDNRS